MAFALSVLPLLVVARYVKEESDVTRANRNPGSSSEPLAQRNEVETSASATQVRPKVLPFVGLGFLIASKKKDERSPDLEFRLDSFNVFNHVNARSFIGTLSSPFFGRANSAYPARELQASVRFSF